ncbi:hypothetical protein XELAEV_18010574mg [Xenopus laevis]|uniref:Uncharacterized protein n=1 Tax=Xenopus laevis TaxID=8355 RepID=A0A974I1V9_XENLA|nr:hypothetical protein XELAEV_18010574mg [Xenopus laevis]
MSYVSSKLKETLKGHNENVIGSSSVTRLEEPLAEEVFQHYSACKIIRTSHFTITNLRSYSSQDSQIVY